jgi:hypothetical protein
MVPPVTPHLVGNTGLGALRAAIADPDRSPASPRSMASAASSSTTSAGRWRRETAVGSGATGCAETASKPASADWRIAAAALAWDRPGRRTNRRAVLDDDGRALRVQGPSGGLRFVVFDVPVLAGVDLRDLAWEERRERLDLLAAAFEVPIELSPVVEPSAALAADMADGRLQGIVLKDRTSTYRDGSRAG